MKSRFLLAFASLFCFLSAGRSQEPAADPGLSVHEWGTFTSIAGAHGEAVVWTPQIQRDDLPSFVEHLRNDQFKGGLQGKVRMETPVLYFYATHQATVSVHVSLEKGLLTEWYPHAVAPLTKQQLSEPVPDLNAANGELRWNSVQLEPGLAEHFPKEGFAGHYYAARETLATPLAVNSPGGPQHEKFLFYRGVSSFDAPVRAVPMNEGRIMVSNRAQTAIAQAILFERRGNRLGYRILGPVQNPSIVDPLVLNSNVEALAADLEKILITEGLYREEAHAMIATWKDSWFEEGTRLLYIVPRSFVDSVLPLTIRPAPASTTRVFVGRMEIVTATTEQAIETAFSTRDQATLIQYGRFLAPFLQVMIARSKNPSRTRELNGDLKMFYSQIYLLLQNRPENLTQSLSAPTIEDSQ